MSTSHEQHREAEQQRIDQFESEGWEYHPAGPEWVRNAAQIDELDTAGDDRTETYHDGEFVYLVATPANELTNGVHVFSKHRSERDENREGYCPNCQAYVRTTDEFGRLTCHRCNWTES
jgi:hypothetical protein